MKHYNGLSGWITATLSARACGLVAAARMRRPPKPGTFGWKINNALSGVHVRVFQRTGGRIAGPSTDHNLRAHPDDVEIDVRGARRRRLRAREATAEEVAE